MLKEKRQLHSILTKDIAHKMKRDENDWCEIEMAFNTWDKMKGNDNAWGETHKPLPEVKKNDEGWKRIILSWQYIL